MKIQLKRIYEKPEPADGMRVLVDRLWPRGISKEKGKIDLWLKEIAPSAVLRKWFNHDPEKWPAFKEKYHQELEKNPYSYNKLKELLQKEKAVTLLYSAKDQKHNQAVVLKELLTA